MGCSGPSPKQKEIDVKLSMINHIVIPLDSIESRRLRNQRSSQGFQFVHEVRMVSRRCLVFLWRVLWMRSISNLGYDMIEQVQT
jgi:hypothetical protein